MKIEMLPLGAIRGAAENPRRHDVDAIKRSYERFGAVETPVIDARTGILVAGHGRVAALRALQAAGATPPDGVELRDAEWHVPVLTGWASATDADAKAYLLASNRLTELARWDEDGLAQLLADVAKTSTLDGTGWTIDDIPDPPPEESDEIPAVAKESWVVPGDVFALGEHRIACMDSTNPESYVAVLGGEVAALLVTDPPWNVGYESIGARDRRPIANDSLGDAFPGFLAAALGGAVTNLAAGGAMYVFMVSAELATLCQVLSAAGCKQHAMLAWVKQRFVLGRRDYHAQWEPIWYGWKCGGPHYWGGDRSESDVLTYDRPSTSADHPTTKPVELLERLVRNSSKPGDIVLEPFSGSGSTLIACERTGRRCRAIELEPQYVQVAIERYEAMSGMSHKKLRSGS